MALLLVLLPLFGCGEPPAATPVPDAGASTDAGTEGPDGAGQDSPDTGPAPAAVTDWLYAGGSDRIAILAADRRSGRLEAQGLLPAGSDGRLVNRTTWGQRAYVQT